MCESYQKIREIFKESCDRILDDPEMESGFEKFEAIYGSKEMKFATYSICQYVQEFAKIWLLTIPEILYKRSQEQVKNISETNKIIFEN